MTLLSASHRVWVFGLLLAPLSEGGCRPANELIHPASRISQGTRLT